MIARSDVDSIIQALFETEPFVWIRSKMEAAKKPKPQAAPAVAAKPAERGPALTKKLSPVSEKQIGEEAYEMCMRAIERGETANYSETFAQVRAFYDGKRESIPGHTPGDRALYALQARRDELASQLCSNRASRGFLSHEKQLADRAADLAVSKGIPFAEAMKICS